MFSVTAGLAGPASGQELNRFPRWGYRDGISLTKQLLPITPLFGVTGGPVLLAGMQYDPPILDDIQEGAGGLWGTYLDVTNELGGSRVGFPLLGVFGASLLTRDTRFQDAAFTSLEAWFYAGLITQGLKRVFGRYRPEEGVGAERFKPFSGHSSFPSGHATAAFALVTPWVLYYPHPLTYGLFALSTGTALARIAHDKHWPTDVIVGSAIGFLTARWLTRRHQQASTRNTGPVLRSNISVRSFSIQVRW